MWKYVTRRVKDTVERTYNILDVRKTWTCHGEAITNGPTANEDVHHNYQDHLKQDAAAANDTENGSTRPRRRRFVCPIRRKIAEYRRQCRQASNLSTAKEWDRSSSKQSSSSSNSSDYQKDHFKQRFDPRFHCNFQQNILGAITWSSALLCGWYTSQLLCIRRRHFVENKYNRERLQICREYEFPNQIFHSSLLPWGQATAKNPFNQQSYWDVDNDNDWKTPVKCIGEAKTNIQSAGVKVNDNKPIVTFESAAQNLTTILSDIEFQLGVNNIDAGQYQTAVAHFKLATSHHHVGATFNLGICYEQGLGVEKNLKLALECYLAAAAMGHAKATYNVGIFYVRGLAGLKRNRTMARKYFIMAAQLGQTEARVALGIRDFNNGKYEKGQMMGSSLPSFSSDGGLIRPPSADSGVYGSMTSL